MRIGILKCGQSPEMLRQNIGDYDDMFFQLLAEQNLEMDSFHVEEMEFPDSPKDRDGWLITGAKHGVYEDLPFIAPLEEFIRDAYAKSIPMVGICFGHQIIAQALGGRVEKHKDGWIIGSQSYDFDDDEGRRQIQMNAWHQDQVVELPPGAKVAATMPGCDYAALIYDNRAFSVQPHPEFSDVTITGLIEHRGGAVPPDILVAARKKVADAPPSRPLADMIGAFFHRAGASS